MDQQAADITSDPSDSPRSPLTTEIFDRLEHAAYVTVGVLISVVALIGLADSVLSIYHGLIEWKGVETIGAIVERLLIVLMMAEILHTVRASMRSGGLSAEPFLIVGMIACIRRILVSTLKSETVSVAQQGEAGFRSELMELGVLGVLILVMVISIYMLRRARAVSDTTSPPGQKG